MRNFSVGDRVVIQRDETLYPSKGTWPRWRGKTGTIVEINLGEYGVCFGKVSPRPDRPCKFNWEAKDVAWFQPYEVRLVRTYLARPLYGVPNAQTSLFRAGA